MSGWLSVGPGDVQAAGKYRDGSHGEREEPEETELSAYVYRRLIINGLRYLTDDLLQLRRMTIQEYNLRMSAAILKRADWQQLMAQNAMFQRAAAATKQVGNNYLYVVHSVDDLYDLEKVERAVFGESKSELKKWHQLEGIARRNQEWLRNNQGKEDK